ncbi:recombinase family protein [Streptomyces eurocidicus]|uniref:DNA invertase Pin-like site-specific DNA recombinase n=1 Tax=Streptomyces eurocidicus TaxID=66423 RepID=A0A7W8BI50_STREU|nr:recombinase family protein [Streptomyces eurocidicus]MBB5122786.1 DNA invertase Pin-like site-specific DNA recombinase [Streptomyces eurocidicus]MBF6051747.1 recombinase family protein [Streptomyces eurocidicus]
MPANSKAGHPEHVSTALRVAAGYTRQSKKKTDKSEASPQTQDQATERKARDRGCSFAGHYRDIGVSGYDPGAKRKNYERLLNDCRTGKIQEIVVFNVTRFSRREPKDAIPVVLELFSLGVTITSVSEGSFSSASTMELIMLIMRLDAAHQDSKNKSEAISGAKRLAKNLGGWTGGTPPYGMESYPESVTRMVDGKPVTVTIRSLRPVARKPDGTDPASVVLRVVDRIFDFKSRPWAGKKNAHPASPGGIGTWLNRTGVPSRKGTGWRNPTVNRMLADPRLAGFAAEPLYRKDKDGNPTRTLDGYRILRDEETGDPIVIGEALIPPARWFELQEWLSEKEWLSGRTSAADTSRSEYLLTAMDVLKCECVRPLTGSPGIYKCSRAKGVQVPGEHVGGLTINQKEVDEHVARRIMAVLMAAQDDPEPEILDILEEAARRLAQVREQPERRGERAALMGERTDVTNAIKQLYDDLDSGIYAGRIGRARFLSDKERLEGRLEAIERRIGEVGGPERPALPIEQWTASEDGDPLGPGSWWETAAVADRRLLVRLFVDEVRVAKATYRGGTKRVCRAAERVTVRMARRQRKDCVRPGSGGPMPTVPYEAGT